MKNHPHLPSIESHLPDLMRFITILAQDYGLGKMNSWQVMSDKVHTFFTPNMMNKVDAIIPGWRRMSSYKEGVTLVHVMCVFTGMLLSPEFRNATTEQQTLMKWIVLFHDIAKEVEDDQRDYTHGFRSTAMAGAILPKLGFSVTDEYASSIGKWSTLTTTAIVKNEKSESDIQDNRKLPKIIAGIEQLFGKHTSGTLVAKGVLLHMSINVVTDWPQVAPLTDVEIGKYIDSELFPLLKAMMLADNDGWSLFDLPTKNKHRQETLQVFQNVQNLISY